MTTVGSYRLDSRAVEDIEAHYQYLLRRDEAAADRMLDAIFAKIEQLSLYPEMGALAPEIAANIRRVTVRPYVIFYCPGVSDVIILRVLHGSRDVPSAMAKDK